MNWLLPGPLKEFADQLVMLAISGAAGAYFRAVLLPEQKWQRRIAQGIGGAFSAIFLGGLAAFLFNQMMDAGPFAYLASGFVMGSAGEAGVKKLQDKLLGQANG